MKSQIRIGINTMPIHNNGWDKFLPIKEIFIFCVECQEGITVHWKPVENTT